MAKIIYLSWNPYLKLLYVCWNFNRKFFECFASKPNAQGTFWNLHIKINFKKLISRKLMGQLNWYFMCVLFSKSRIYWGRRVIGISGFLIWSKTLMELIFNPYGEFRWRPECTVSHIHSPNLHVGASRIFRDILRSIQTLQREWRAESNGKLPPPIHA